VEKAISSLKLPFPPTKTTPVSRGRTTFEIFWLKTAPRYLSDKKKIGELSRPLSRMLGASNVAVVTATVSRRILPLVYDETLTASSVMEEERSHAASGRVAAWVEVTVDEPSGSARCGGISCYARGIMRNLHRT
jgi:hypothetical protein